MPRGNFAAVAVGGTVSSTFVVASDGGRPLPLEERVRAAVDQAQILCGAGPTEVRLVCVDDGSDGADLERIQQWLSDVVEAQILVLDLVGPIVMQGSMDDIDDETALSVARACEAALW